MTAERDTRASVDSGTGVAAEHGTGVTAVRIAARRLAEQMHRSGDVHFHYDRAVLGEEGIAAQRQLAAGGPWQCEVPVTAEYVDEAYVLKVSGRIDMVDETAALPCLVEVKSTRSDLSRLHAHLGNVHWAQLKLYGHMFALARGWRQLRLRLHYLHLDTGASAHHDQDCSAAELQTFFATTCAAYVAWRAELDGWRRKRDATLKATAFPFSGYRVGQRALAVAAFRAHRDGAGLVCEAPTGLGKTAALVYPALQAIAHGHADRVLYLSARGTGQAAALDTLRSLRAQGAALRQVQIIAKEKVCLTPGAACAAETCRYAAGHFDRAPAALVALRGHAEVGLVELQAVGRDHCACPFELSLAAARWADVVVCDYNYVLDPVIRSASIIAEGARRTCVLIDEAHQLPDRTREMYSATISRDAILAAAKVAGQIGAKPIARAATRLARTMKTLAGSRTKTLATAAHDQPVAARDARAAAADEAVLIDDAAPFDRDLAAFIAACAPWIDATSPAVLTDAYFQATLWRATDRTAAVTPYAVISRWQGRDAVYTRYCIDPSIPAALSLKPFRSVQAFSGTLPGRQPLGIPGDPPPLRFGSPFPAGHLGVFVVRDLSVYFRDRAGTVARLARLVCDLCAARAGNYLVFAPSFAYVELLATALAECAATLAEGAASRAEGAASRAEGAASRVEGAPGFEQFSQARHMDDAQRAEFIARFVADGRTRIGIAATGGVFGESVDLAGERLIGVIVVGIALPPRSLERELVRAAEGDEGEARAYQYPAMIRVLQTAGRLIRSAQDRGVLCLVDARFAAQPYRGLLPTHWRTELVPGRDIGAAARAFWQRAAVPTAEADGATPEPAEFEPATDPARDGSR